MNSAGPGFAAPLPEPAWGGLVAAYLVVIGLPSGLGLLTWWLATHEAPGAAWFERRAAVVSVVALVAVGALLTADLGRPGGFYLMVTRFELSSPISVGAKLVAIKAALLALALYAGARHRRFAAAVGPVASAFPGGRIGTTLPSVVRTLVAVVSFALAIYPAALLSRTWSSPFGATSGAALLFLTTSLLLAVAAAVTIVLAGALRRGTGAPVPLPILRRLLLALLTGHAVAVLLQALAVAGDPRLDGAVAAVTTGRYAALWWAGAVAAGVATPVAALGLFPRRSGAVLLAALGAAAGAAITRYLLFATGG